MNRRSVLGLTATTAIGLAMARVSPAQAAVSGPMSALSEYMSAAGTRALPPDVSEHVKHHLIDTMAAMI